MDQTNVVYWIHLCPWIICKEDHLFLGHPHISRQVVHVGFDGRPGRAETPQVAENQTGGRVQKESSIGFYMIFI